MQVPSSSNSPYPPPPQLTSASPALTGQTGKAPNTRQMPLPATISDSDPSSPSPAPKKARTFAVFKEEDPPGGSASSPTSASITAASEIAAPILTNAASGNAATMPTPAASSPSQPPPNRKKANISSNELEKLHQDALKGDAAAQTLMGSEYFKGEVLPQNYMEGLRWLRFAANQNFAMAYGHLSHCYAYGIGVPKNTKQAEALFCKAALLSSVRGILSNSYKFILGTDLIRNHSDFFRWHLPPAKRGNGIAYNIVACCHLLGIGIRRNEKEGLRLLRLAAANGDPLALYNLGECYELCLGINAQAEFPSLSFFESVSKAEMKALEYYRQAADLGLALAQNALGFHYLHGFSIEYNPQEAVRLIRLAALQGLPAAQTQLGDCLLAGIGVDPNPKEALTWYRMAANQGDKGGMEKLARHTENSLEANRLYRRLWWKHSIGLESIRDPYFHMTAVEPINWGELLTRCSPSYIEIWKQDEDLHERTGIAFIDSLDVPTLRSMPDLLFIAIIERVCGYIHQTIKSAPFTEERLTLLKPALKFIPTLKTLCKERKPSNVIELLNRLTLALAEPYVALYDYLPALNHFREIIHPCPKADVKLAKLLYYCEGWRFPEIAHWHQRYALIAALMDSSKEELQEDEKAILRNVKEVLKQSLLEGKTDLVSPFYDLLSRIHVEDYFRYHSMKIRLKEALSRNASSQPPRNLQFLLPLSDAVETYFGRCGAYLPPLLPAHDIEALHLLVECCLKLAASNEPEETFKKVQHPLNSPLVQKWMAIIPAFAGSLGSFLPK